MPVASAKLPPPLPPRPIVPEPFLPAKSEPPAVDRDRDRDTPRSGGVPVYDPDPRDQIIRDMQAQLALLREQLDTTSSPPPTRPSERVRRAQKAKAVAVFGSKWTIAAFLLPIAGAAVAKHWPGYADLIDAVLGGLGLK
jgi:hypothetical protein